MNEFKVLEKKIADLPKGSITKKVIQGKDRYYLQWREGEKVRSRYVKGGELPELSRQIELRKSLQQELQNLQVSSIYASSKFYTGAVAETGVRYCAHKKNAIVEKVVNFFLDLRRGFCVECMQGGGDPDIVFYNRFLHCGVIVLLKDDVFKDKYLDELNACVSYYGEHEVRSLDGCPVGILLCLRKCERTVEFSTMGDDSSLNFAYKAVLPTNQCLRDFLEGVR